VFSNAQITPSQPATVCTSTTAASTAITTTQTSADSALSSPVLASLVELLCCCGYENKQAYFHEWIGNKKKAGEGKKLKLLQEMYPSRKMDELEMLADMMTTKELKHLAQEQCWDDKKIDKFF
jgi:hypothetical protein